MRSRTAALLIGPALGLALLAGCGDEGPTGASDPAGTEPITPRAMAAIALDHLPPDPTKAELVVYYSDVPDPADAERQEAAGDPVEVAIRYGSDYGGDRVSVAVGAPRDGDPCARGQLNECVELEPGVLYLSWVEEEPEEDPGVVQVLSRRDGVDVLARYTGDAITGDPRDLDLGVTVDQLVEVATDPRISTTTTSEAVEAGNDLAVWRGED